MPQIKYAEIRRISLCPRGSNQMPVLYKSEDNSIRFDSLIKADMDQGLITAIVYVPNREDSQGDWAEPAVIEKMAHDFLTNGEGINLRHGDKVLAKEQATVVESFIVQKDDPRFKETKDYSGNAVDVTGAWAAVIKIDDEAIRKDYREGKWGGVSMEGAARLDLAKDDTSLISKMHTMLNNLLGQKNNIPQGDLDMKPEEVKKMITESVQEVLKEAGLIKKEAKPEGKTKEKKDAPVAPIFKGEYSDEVAVKEHEKLLQVFKAEQTFAEDPSGLFNAIKTIEKEFAEDTDELDVEAGIEKEDTSEVKVLKRSLAKAQRAPNQGIKKEEKKEAYDDMIGISKAEQDLVSQAQASAREFNGEKPEK